MCRRYKPLTWGYLHVFLNLLYGYYVFKTTAKWKHVATIKTEGTLTGQGLSLGMYAEMVMVDN